MKTVLPITAAALLIASCHEGLEDGFRPDGIVLSSPDTAPERILGCDEAEACQTKGLCTEVGGA